MGDVNIMAGFSSIISRGFTGSIQPLYHYLEIFPNQVDWLYGTTFPNPQGIFPFKPYNLTVEVMNHVYPENYSTGVVGTMPTIYWGELYANFGIYGLVIFPFYVGFALFWVNRVVFQRGLNPLNAALFTWLLVHYKNLSITSFTNFLLDLNLCLIILVYLLITVRLNSPNKPSLNIMRADKPRCQ
jgi:hypothetical protein